MVEEWLFLWTEIPGETVSNWSALFHLQLKSLCILNTETNRIFELGGSELYCAVAGSHQVEKQHRNAWMGMDMENTGKQCCQCRSPINIHSKTHTTLSTLSQRRLIHVMVTLIHLTCSLGYLTNWSPMLYSNTPF